MAAKKKKCKAKGKKAPGGINMDMPIERVARSSINPAAYNPRRMDAANKAKLRHGLQEFGLVEALVWNKRTGNLVGGHQRLSVLDDEYKRQDYQVPVAVVDLDDARERALNVALNNPQLQGDWDYDKLRSVLIDIQAAEIDTGLTGFDDAEIRTLTIDISDPGVPGLDGDFDYSEHEGRSAAKDVPYLMVIFEGTGQLDKARDALGLKKGVKRVFLAEEPLAKRVFQQLWAGDTKAKAKRKGKAKPK